MDEKKIIYFIMSHSVDMGGKMTFQWPVLPDPTMGVEFIEKIKAEHAEIAEWIKKNHVAFWQAQNGYYKRFV